MFSLDLIFGSTPPGEMIGEIVLWAVSPAFESVVVAEDRQYQYAELLQMAVILALFKQEQGQYPQSLAELVPNYLAAVPTDVFAQQPLQYRRTDAGYLLYSVGHNGTDDGGKEDYHEDLVIRMPYSESLTKSLPHQ